MPPGIGAGGLAQAQDLPQHQVVDCEPSHDDGDGPHENGIGEAGDELQARVCQQVSDDAAEQDVDLLLVKRRQGADAPDAVAPYGLEDMRVARESRTDGTGYRKSAVQGKREAGRGVPGGGGVIKKKTKDIMI